MDANHWSKELVHRLRSRRWEINTAINQPAQLKHRAMFLKFRSECSLQVQLMRHNNLKTALMFLSSMIFQYHNLLLSQTANDKKVEKSYSSTPGYMQWRDFCTASSDGFQRRKVFTGTQVHIPNKATKKYMHALPYLYYGDAFNPRPDGQVVDQVGIRVQPIFLGTPRDGFYAKTNFIKWLVRLRFT